MALKTQRPGGQHHPAWPVSLPARPEETVVTPQPLPVITLLCAGRPQGVRLRAERGAPRTACVQGWTAGHGGSPRSPAPCNLCASPALPPRAPRAAREEQGRGETSTLQRDGLHRTALVCSVSRLHTELCLLLRRTRSRNQQSPSPQGPREAGTRVQRPWSQGPEVVRAALRMPELSPAQRMDGGSRGRDTAVLRPSSQRRAVLGPDAHTPTHILRGSGPRTGRTSCQVTSRHGQGTGATQGLLSSETQAPDPRRSQSHSG